MQFSFCSTTPEQTAAFARRLGPALRAGDTVLLFGPVGAGKSLWCRSVIQGLQADAGQAIEDVPSPSYTLVQAYSIGAHEVWHTDLYRLGDTSELTELGLEQAMQTAIVLVEWPDRLGHARPTRALEITLDPLLSAENTRKITVNPIGPNWSRALQALSA